MHISRHIVQQLVLQLGTPVMERWSFSMGEEEFAELAQHRALGRAHDVTLLIIQGDELAAVRKPHYPMDTYSAPSGGIHPEESFMDGAIREAREETGLDVEIQGYPLYVMVSFTCGDESAKWASHVLTARPLTHELGAVDVSAVASARWIGWEELLNDMNPRLRDSGLGELAYRARLHEKAHELLVASRVEGDTRVK